MERTGWVVDCTGNIQAVPHSLKKKTAVSNATKIVETCIKYWKEEISGKFAAVTANLSHSSQTM